MVVGSMEEILCEGLRNDILGRGILPEKVTVIPNAVDIENFRVDEKPDLQLAMDLGLNGKLLLGFIGSFYAYEGLNILLRALPKILSQNPDIQILLVGGGPQENELKALAVQLDIDDKIVFTGRVPHDQVHRYYNLIDVLVYPRLQMRLTDLVTPLKPLEAMAQGKLLMASDVGGHLELIQDRETGIIFESGNPDALATKVLDLLSRSDSWPALRAAARNYVETERNWPVSVARYKDVYGSLVNKEILR